MCWQGTDDDTRTPAAQLDGKRVLRNPTSLEERSLGRSIGSARGRRWIVEFFLIVGGFGWWRDLAGDVVLAVIGAGELVVANRPDQVFANLVQDHRQMLHMVRESRDDSGELRHVGRFGCRCWFGVLTQRDASCHGRRVLAILGSLR